MYRQVLYFTFIHGALLSRPEQIREGSRTNFLVKKFEVCSPRDSPIQFDGKMSVENGKQYYDFNIILTVPLDENYAMVCIIAVLKDKVTVPLFTIRDKNYCTALNRYVGEFWYNLERRAQITPGVCPIQQGRYHGHHILLDFNSIALQTFPFGRLRFTTQAVDKRNGKTVLCTMMEVENMPF